MIVLIKELLGKNAVYVTCDQEIGIRRIGLELAIDPPPPQGEFCTL